MKYAVEMASHNMMNIPRFMIGLSIQVILKLLPQQFDILQCWYCWWKGFMKYDIERDSCGMIYIPSLIKNGSGFQKSLGRGGYTYRHTNNKVIS
jgi:hypothetical protein